MTPLDDRFTFYLPVTNTGGDYRVYLRNPERNLGVFLSASRLELHGDEVRLIGRRGDSAVTLVRAGYEDGNIGVRLRGGAWIIDRWSRLRHREPAPPGATAAWEAHGAGERLSSFRETRATFAAVLPEARVRRHLVWRYSAVWQACTT